MKAADVWPEKTLLAHAVIDAAVRLGGGGPERELAEEAARFGENGDYGPPAHYAQAVRALEREGIFQHERLSRQSYYLTERAWRLLGQDGPAPGSGQESLL